MTAQEIPINSVDLEALDAFLSSDRAPEDGMMLSDLDGFLTGIAIGPALVMPSEWLPIVWGGGEPNFADEAEAKTVLGSIMGRYNQILREVEEEELDPIFWTDRDGTVLPFDWAEGFMTAIGLRVEAWRPLLKSKRNGHLLFPILALCGDQNGESLFELTPEEEDAVMDEAPDMVPACVTAIAAYWRSRGPSPISATRRAGADSRTAPPRPKIGRNDPCPCGSGKKLKKCCGRNA
jgi:uncharacterized protein